MLTTTRRTIYTVTAEAAPAYRADFHTREEAEMNAAAVAVTTGRTAYVTEN